ncbi:MAG: hypothetical protein AAB779_01370 [Patescibacteria group bacterium]
MENQQDLDQSVTKREFQAHANDFQGLKKDFQEFVSFAVETFATKQDLKEGLFANKEDVRRIVEKSEERILQAWNQVMTGNDAIAKEVKAMRQEQAAHFGSHKRQDEEIVQVKRRLDKVEAHVGLV